VVVGPGGLPLAVIGGGVNMPTPIEVAETSPPLPVQPVAIVAQPVPQAPRPYVPIIYPRKQDRY
jgi:hypothetical protein